MEWYRRGLVPTLLLFLPLTTASAKDDVDFVRDVQPILRRHCYSCHGEEKQKGSLRLDIRSEAFRGGDSFGPSIISAAPDESPIFQFIADDTADLQMPPDGPALSQTEKLTIQKWIEAGADWPAEADTATIVDRRDHWSFKPVVRKVPPITADPRWPRNAIDNFVLSQLEDAQLRPAPEADRRTWLRRVSLDLTGLPPTSEELAHFLSDSSAVAFETVVDRLLDSPAYGERWGQHWLDVVRYADTDGFEVNTPRTNAWPYRDYVIDALNRDLPYDQFIREQLAGDQFQRDAATGFLVTAAALLPGQIGQDDVSKRIARQDELAEIVINTGESFLGLSIGCARCHDHKFDAISQRDYYAMQAFFAGVRYGDRPIRRDGEEVRVQRLAELLAQDATLQRELENYSPLAQVDSHQESTNAKRNEAEFPATTARFVRMKIETTKLHPNLGSIEPCIDELEIFAADTPDQNVALASFGTLVSASGSRQSPAHQLAHVNDGLYGNNKSWMADSASNAWLLFELPEAMSINRVVWSRDREGQFDDRLPLRFTIEVGASLDQMTPVSSSPELRAAITPTRNIDRFAPLDAIALRFTILATNNLEPCLDELEIFDRQGNNVALASAGAAALSSGDIEPTSQHQLAHVNDGQFGNDRSWISNSSGSGWVEIQFPVSQKIDRVVWGRDRQGKFKDRLPTEYEIHAVLANGMRVKVADASDRLQHENSPPGATAEIVVHSKDRDSATVKNLLATRERYRTEILELQQQEMVFAGQFTSPDTTYLLLRGDSEQPSDEVAPTFLSAFSEQQLPSNAPDAERRLALANWIASPNNPLTARVIANRIWQGHFGMGIVDTPSDFGRSGGKPSHPELLDWLANELVYGGWSLKHLHRLMVLSATYRQSNRIQADAFAVDSDNRLLWRFPSRRLEAESIRDCMVMTSGRMERSMGGPGFDLFGSRGGLNGFPPVESFTSIGLKRLIYAHKVRMERDAVFGAFDCPDAGQSTARRRQSTTPIQALNLFNSNFTLEESQAFAARVANEVGSDIQRQTNRVYQIALGREPDEHEWQLIEPVVREHGLPTLCRVLYNSNEFLFLP